MSIVIGKYEFTIVRLLKSQFAIRNFPALAIRFISIGKFRIMIQNLHIPIYKVCYNCLVNHELPQIDKTMCSNCGDNPDIAFISEQSVRNLLSAMKEKACHILN
jgi:rRNA maturation endonuclease Nob1